MLLIKLIAFEPLHQRFYRLCALLLHCQHDQFLFASHFLFTGGIGCGCAG
jgi:hypothetical protein